MALAAPVARAPRGAHRRGVLLGAGARRLDHPPGGARSTSPTRHARTGPFTTIAWRIAHIIVGVLGARAQNHLDGPTTDYRDMDLRHDAASLRELDTAYAAWFAGVQGLWLRARAG